MKAYYDFRWSYESRFGTVGMLPAGEEVFRGKSHGPEYAIREPARRFCRIGTGQLHQTTPTAKARRTRSFRKESQRRAINFGFLRLAFPLLLCGAAVDFEVWCNYPNLARADPKGCRGTSGRSACQPCTCLFSGLMESCHDKFTIRYTFPFFLPQAAEPFGRAVPLAAGAGTGRRRQHLAPAGLVAYRA